MYKELQKATESMNRLEREQYVSEGINDQVFLQKIIKRKDAKFKMFHADLFPDGMWYYITKQQSLNLKKDTKINLINNNWIVGIEAKMARAKDWRHWFVKDNDKDCDENAIKNIVEKI